MNPEILQRPDLIGLSSFLTGPLALVLSTLWVASHVVRQRERYRESQFSRIAFFLGGTLLGYIALWSLFQFMGSFLVLSTDWSLSLAAFLGAFAMEALVALYQLEKTLTTPRRGRILLALRCTALVLLILVLLQPVRSFLVNREINREVAVLIDDSQSMHLPDQRLTVSEQLDRSMVLGVEGLENRPNLHGIANELNTFHSELLAESSALESSPDPAALLKSRAEQLGNLLENGNGTLKQVEVQIQTITANTNLPNDAKNRLNDFRSKLNGQVSQLVTAADKQLENGNPVTLLQQLKALVKPLGESLTVLPTLGYQIDQAFHAQLKPEVQEAIGKAAARPRVDIARQLLHPSSEGNDADDKQNFLDKLSQDYNLTFYRFARTIEEFPDVSSLEEESPADSSTTFRSLTDLAGALDHILENTSPESLAGVLLLSDGRHNANTLPEDHLRRMASQKSPLCAIPIGSQLGPIDASILSLKAPESIYLGDRIVVRAEVKLDGLRGKKIKAILSSNGDTVDEQLIDVNDIEQRQEIRFVHLPEEKGIYDYQLSLEPNAAEQFSDNNSWDFKVAITDDRTNVLLVDSYPRWEFRYLRNLFYGRDKSVHLQYVLLNPDPIEGQDPLPAIHASAARKFGDAEATRLPENEDAWRLFDVIILGDIPPAAIDSKTWSIIQKSVAEQGTLLVTIAGQRYMPHEFRSPDFVDMAPATWTKSLDAPSKQPEEGYQLQLTSAGRSHMLTQLSVSRAENARLWSHIPTLHWRFHPDEIKESAEVLAYASSPSGQAAAERGFAGGPGTNPEEVEKALQALANKKQFERDNALIVAHQYALGKVVQLNFDRTWRLRYGVGDTYHHRFWGQVLRWGTGENLRSGTEYVRLGTDHLSYTPSDPIKVVTKLLDSKRRPITNATMSAVLLDENGDAQHSQRLSFRSGSNGMYETTLAPLTKPGKYTIRIESGAVEKALKTDPNANMSELDTEILVVSTRNPVELAELTADYDFLTHATQLSNGSMANLTDASSLIPYFGAPKETLTERRNITLWDKWPLLLAFLGLFTSEWVFRRRAGLP